MSAPSKSRCAAHRAGVVARCTTCHLVLCDGCFRYTLDARPACARCAFETATRSPRRISLAAVFVTFVGVIVFWLTRRYPAVISSTVELGFIAVATIAVGAFIAFSGRSATSATVAPRDPEEPLGELDPAVVGAGTPYRVHARRALLAVSPRVSGTATAAIVLACFAATAVLLPTSIRLPRWIEAEVVLGAWWIVLGVTLTTLLYRGFRLRDDLVYFAPWDRPSKPGDAKGSSSSSGGSSFGPLDLAAVDGEGCAIGLVVLVVLGVAFAAAWVVVEAVPIVFLVFYAVFMRALRIVSRDSRSSAGNLARSAGWGILWATVSMLPLAAIAAIVGAIHR